MSIGQTIKMAFKSIGNNKVRSFLTMLGIIIGVAAVISIVSVIQSSSRLQRLQYEALGSNQITVWGYGPSKSDWSAFENYLDTELSEEVRAWTPLSYYWDYQNRDITYDTKKLSSDGTTIYFANQDYGTCTNNVIALGRDITAEDCKNNAKVCVIGETVRKAFFGIMNPIDQTIRIAGNSFTVVGVYNGKYDGKLNSEDQMILLPYTLEQRLNGYVSSDRNYYVQAETKDDIQPLIDNMRDFMYLQYDFGDYGYFDAYSNMMWQDQNELAQNQYAIVGGGVAAISLLVGGIGIMNIMLVSVTERTREIGIRMAVGARKKDIIRQFLIESAVVSGLGGLIGIILGSFVSALLGNMLLEQQIAFGPQIEHFTVLPSWWLVVGAFLFSAILGIVFGLYPANKASNMQPVDALRSQ